MTKLEQRLDVEVFAHFFGQANAALGHEGIDLSEMPQFLDGGFDEFRNNFDAVRVFCDETHGHGGRLPFAIGMVLQEGGEIGQDGAHPGRMGCPCEFKRVFHAIKVRYARRVYQQRFEWKVASAGNTA